MKTHIAPIEVCIADDHEMVCLAIAPLIDKEPDMKVIGKAANGAALINLIKQNSLLRRVSTPGLAGGRTRRILKKLLTITASPAS